MIIRQITGPDIHRTAIQVASMDYGAITQLPIRNTKIDQDRYSGGEWTRGDDLPKSQLLK